MEELLKPPARFLLMQSEAYAQYIETIPSLRTVEEAQEYLDMLEVDVEAINEQILFYKETGLYPNPGEWNDAEHWLRSAGWKRYACKVKIKIVSLSISRYLEGTYKEEAQKKIDGVAGKLGQQIGEEGAKRANAIEGLEKRLSKLVKWLEPGGEGEGIEVNGETGPIYSKLNYLDQKLSDGFKTRVSEEKRLWAAIKKEKKTRGIHKEHLDKRVLYIACLLFEQTGEALDEIKKFIEKYPDWRAEIERRLAERLDPEDSDLEEQADEV